MCVCVSVYVNDFFSPSETVCVNMPLCSVGVQVCSGPSGFRVSCAFNPITPDCTSEFNPLATVCFSDGFPVHAGGALQKTYEMTPLLSDNRVRHYIVYMLPVSSKTYGVVVGYGILCLASEAWYIILLRGNNIRMLLMWGLHKGAIVIVRDTIRGKWFEKDLVVGYSKPTERELCHEL